LYKVAAFILPTKTIHVIKNLVYLLFLLFPCLSYSQIDYTLSYFPLINKADLEISKGEYSTALDDFQSAFATVSGGQSIDFVNAIVCAIKTNQPPIAFQLLDSLLYLYVEANFLDTFKGFTPLKAHPDWSHYREQYPERQKTLPWKINEPLKDQIEALMYREAGPSTTYDSKPMGSNYNKDKLNEALKDQIEALMYQKPAPSTTYSSQPMSSNYNKDKDIENVNNYIEIVKTYGLPHERLVGANMPMHHIPGHKLLYLHCSTLHTVDVLVPYDFTNDFFESIIQGRASPHNIAYLLSLQDDSQFQIIKTRVVQLIFENTKTDLMCAILTPKETTLINTQRVLHGMEILDEYYQKVSFAINDPEATDFLVSKYKSWYTRSVFNQMNFEKALANYKPLPIH
jgi:hypothetical protein